MKNPFAITGIVDEPWFCNRREEQAELRQRIENSQNVLLFFHRRLGKTSLILKVFKSLKDVTPVYVDLYGTTGTDGFIKAFIKGVSVIEPKGSRIIKLLRENLSNIPVSFGFDSISQAPNLNVSFERQPLSADIEAVFKLVRAAARKKKIVIAFDAFQEIAGYGTEAFEKELRKVIQHHQNIACIFAGSRRHILAAINQKKALKLAAATGGGQLFAANNLAGFKSVNGLEKFENIYMRDNCNPNSFQVSETIVQEPKWRQR